MSKEYEIEILNSDPGDVALFFKLIIIGDPSVGKSCLALRAINGTFESLYTPTIGFGFFTFYLKIDNLNVKLQVWDTCGQETYCSLTDNYFRNASLAFIVYSIDSKESFNNLEFWLNELRVKANPDINIFVIGNKCDLEDKRQITKDMAKEFCENNKIKLFLETSAKTGFNAQNIFIEASKLLYEQQLRNKMRVSNSDSFQNIARDSNNGFPMDDIYEDDKNKKRKKCC